MKTSVSIRSVALVLALSVLAGCGRAGAPLRPSQAAVLEAKETGALAPRPVVPNAAKPDKRFILDGLLE